MLHRYIYILFLSFVLSNKVGADYNQYGYGYSSASSQNPKPNRILVKQYDIVDSEIDYDNYIVGPGDIFILDIVNLNLASEHPLLVSVTGDVLIPLIGTINVKGMNLSEAFNAIKNKCISQYEDAKINLVLYQSGKFKINISNRYGVLSDFIINSTTRLSEVYQKFIEQLKKQTLVELDLISSRNINIVRDGDTLFCDLEKYKLNGQYNNNPYLRRDDEIVINDVNNSVLISGSNHGSKNYEILNSESLKDIVDLGGFLFENNILDSIQIFRRNSNSLENIELSYSDADSFILKDKDNIILRFDNRISNSVALVDLFGEFKYPGHYSIDIGSTTISDLLSLCGGFSPNADSSRLLLYHQDYFPINTKGGFAVKPADYMSISEVSWSDIQKEEPLTKKVHIMSSEQFSNYILMPGDRLRAIPVMDYVDVIGGVNKPGRYNFKDTYNVYNYISIAGGLSNNSAKDLYVIPYGSQTRLPIYKYDRIYPGDILFIPNKMEVSSWYRFKDWMTVVSQIATLVVLIQNIVE